jgi:hypothetical protein
MDIILKEKKKGEGGQQREQKLLQQRKRVASPRVWVFPVGLVYYLFVVCVVLSCIENNNASRGQTILGYSPGLLYSKCPCLVLLPISCRPRSTTADMTSSTQLSVRFFPPPQDRGSRPPIERSTYVCQTAIFAKIGIWTSQSVRPSFFSFTLFFFLFIIIYYFLLALCYPVQHSPSPFFVCVWVSRVSSMPNGVVWRRKSFHEPHTSNCFGCTLNGPTNQTTLSDRAFRRSSSTHMYELRKEGWQPQF